jgi:peptide/nickel transport system substrate-binding protein
MHKFILFIKEFRIYKKQELLDAIASFSRKQFLVFIGIFAIAIVSMVIILEKINSMFLVDVPVSGGTITEGIIGVPTLVNPVIALSDADKDLTSLVYSGLMRKTPDGNFIPDLAESFEVTPDGINYTFVIKNDAKFQDGKSVTADDVIFTIERIKDPIIKSPRKMKWDGVSVSKKDDYTVVFTLASPYISFIDNTTTGILPSYLWKNVNVNEFNLSLLNTKAIGSGPYKIKNVLKNKDGVPEKYELVRFNNFSLGKPIIKKVNIISYANERDLVGALLNHSIDQAGGISPEYIESIKNKNYKVRTATLPRIFGIFFNSNNNKIFNDSAVLKALDKGIDRQYIIDQVLGGYGAEIYNPIPEKIIPSESNREYTNKNIEEANTILDKAGWVLGNDGIRTKGGTTTTNVTKKVKGKTIKQVVKSATPLTRLSFSLTTGDTPELKQTTLLLKEQLQKIGIEVDIQKVYETGQLNQIIRARDYEALLFGQLINYESDLYSYWHSSQKTDPGKNIAMYSNKKVDSILELIQKTLNMDDRMNKYEELLKEFNINTPAILIYSPKYLYVTGNRLNNTSFSNITVPADRFSFIYKWSTDTDKVWKIFTK